MDTNDRVTRIDIVIQKILKDEKKLKHKDKARQAQAYCTYMVWRPSPHPPARLARGCPGVAPPVFNGHARP